VVVLVALAFPCIVIGLVGFVFGGSPVALAFPCFVSGLLASPLCGAALTFFAAAKKVSKESGLGFNRSLQHLCSNTESEGKALWNDRESIG
jgi:hypothetical protein